MRKNKMMRAASALLVAVLLTTCAISSTFAKYVTTDEFTDTARVAKWGVELQIVGNLYGDTYQDALVANDAGALIAVQASDAVSGEGTDVVAPGTENNNGLNISLNGTPEVDGSVDVLIQTSNIYLANGTYGVMIPVTIDPSNYDEYYAAYNSVQDNEELFYSLDSGATFNVAGSTFISDPNTKYYTLEDKYTLTDTMYYPVVYSLTGSTAYTPTANVYTTDTLYEIAMKIMQQFGFGSNPTPNAGVTTFQIGDVYFGSNTDLATKFNLGGSTITWEWAFENRGLGQDGISGSSDDVDYDGADTILGLLGSRAAGELNAGSQVVVLSGDNYVPAVEYTDYCLNTSFDITITVSQEDGNVALTETTTAVPSP